MSILWPNRPCKFIISHMRVKPTGHKSFIHVWYIFILSHTCNLFSFVQNQSAASNDPHASANPSPNQWWYLWLLMILLFEIVVDDDGALGLLVNLFVIYCETCDVCDIYVTFVIYMWCWWYICDVDDIYVMLVMFVIYIFCLFGWDVKKCYFQSLCRVQWPWHSAKWPSENYLGTCFAECNGHCTRQTS